MTNTSPNTYSIDGGAPDQQVTDMLKRTSKRVVIDFVPAENGHMEESKYSMIDRIVSMWGFERKQVVPLEASTNWFELGGMQFNVYSSVQFSVNGKGWSTDFKRIERDSAYDVEE